MSHGVAHRNNQPAVRPHAPHVHAIQREDRPRKPSRFCRNGNVIILKAGIAGLHTNAAIPAGIGQQNSFIVENAQGVKKAVVTPEGEVYLAGQLFIGQANLAPPASGTAFMVKDGDRVMVMIDEQGNLKLRGGLILRGIPYVLWQFMDGQGPPNSAPDDVYRPW